ncbi:hypothetical protein NHX12_004892 [Muraenolepis orangiensis]|uniref:Clusterin n=1 Tax=Muraenolepis orangiensis TaxID=630683 RepID=A0A9Q0DW58_9TELE|nr:hypothetical protein NHX12_004892 [Muraenolepis orangiensis]
MRLLLLLLVTIGLLRVRPARSEAPPTPALPEDTLKQLSRDGEKLVDEEVQRALSGVREMREVMRSNTLKHQQLMKSLKDSGEKKEGAAQLTREVTDRLEKAEEQCRDSLQSEWEQCRPCLEEACKTFYISTCRRGFASFRAKADSFFRRVSGRFGPREPTAEAGDVTVNQDLGSQTDTEAVARIEASFSQLVRRVGGLVERSGALGVGLAEVLDSFLDFGRSVMEEFGAVVVGSTGGPHEALEGDRKRARGLLPRYLHSRRLCRGLRRQTSECWQLQDQCDACQGPLLKECPSVRELHGDLEDASQLLDVSRELYQEVLSVVQRHAEQTLVWLGQAAAEVGWVGVGVVAPAPEEETPAVGGESTSAGDRPWSTFRITSVLPKSSGGVETAEATETEVQVHIFNSPPLIFSVPGELKIKDPGFLQYVTQEALGRYWDTVRLEDE